MSEMPSKSHSSVDTSPLSSDAEPVGLRLFQSTPAGFAFFYCEGSHASTPFQAYSVVK